MKSRYHQLALLPLLLAGIASAQAQGPSGNCVELRNDVQMEIEFTDASGQKSIRLMPPSKVVPGNQVVYIITARNVCKKPVDKLVLNNPVPDHLSYVADSASGSGTDITFSVDGKNYSKAEALVVQDAEGHAHAARNEDIRSIRWILNGSLAPGQSTAVRFRAAVN
jgi:uncharacterized repeat protein (TIGR01451 family)